MIHALVYFVLYVWGSFKNQDLKWNDTFVKWGDWYKKKPRENHEYTETAIK